MNLRVHFTRAEQLEDRPGLYIHARHRVEDQTLPVNIVIGNTRFSVELAALRNSKNSSPVLTGKPLCECPMMSV